MENKISFIYYLKQFFIIDGVPNYKFVLEEVKKVDNNFVCTKNENKIEFCRIKYYYNSKNIKVNNNLYNLDRSIELLI